MLSGLLRKIGGDKHANNSSNTNIKQTGNHYYMKIIIKGDKNVGKTALWKRLQGLCFDGNYQTTSKSQLATITWQNKSNDVVLVDIWDIADVTVKKKKQNELKILNSEANKETHGNEFVYNEVDGVIFIFDITKAWTWDNVKRELNNVPNNIPILILANRYDMHHHRQVTIDLCNEYISEFNKQSNRENITAARIMICSMKYAFGLKNIHLFFNIPFLNLRKKLLQKQIEENAREIILNTNELDSYHETAEAEFENFMNNTVKKNHPSERKISNDITRKNDYSEVDNEYNADHSTDNDNKKLQSTELDNTISDVTHNLETTKINETSHEYPQHSRENSFEDQREDNCMVTKFEEDFVDDEDFIVKIQKLTEKRKIQEKVEPEENLT